MDKEPPMGPTELWCHMVPIDQPEMCREALAVADAELAGDPAVHKRATATLRKIVAGQNANA